MARLEAVRQRMQRRYQDALAHDVIDQDTYEDTAHRIAHAATLAELHAVTTSVPSHRALTTVSHHQPVSPETAVGASVVVGSVAAGTGVALSSMIWGSVLLFFGTLFSLSIIGLLIGIPMIMAGIAVFTGGSAAGLGIIAAGSGAGAGIAAGRKRKQIPSLRATAKRTLRS